jgi:prevent-host-death family protein
MPDDTERKQDDDESETPEVVGIVRAREILGEIAMRAGYGNERIVLTKNGKPTAVVIGMKDLERLRALDTAAAA